MARRLFSVSEIAGRETTHDGWLEAYAVNRELNPYDAAWMAEEAKRILEGESRNDQHVRVFLTGCRAWSATELQARPCPVCHGLPKPPGWYCGGCDSPKGTLARTVKPKAPGGGTTTKPLKIRVETRKEKRAKKGRKAA